MEYVVSFDRRQRKRQVVHQRLLDISTQLFEERGITRTTVDDIAEAADVARQTVFNHFPYKEAFALEIASNGIQETAQHAQALLEAGVSGLEVLQRVAERVFDVALGNGELASVVARELLHPDPERARRAAQKVPLCQIFEAILVQAREEGSVRPDLPLGVVAGRISAVLRSILAEVLGGDTDRLRQELAVCFDIVFNGIVDRRK